MKPITLTGRAIGPGHPCYIIAEMSANHGQSFEKALEVVRAAKNAGADAIKLQTYTADTLTLDSRRPEFMVGAGSLWEGKNLHELYAEAYTPWEWQPQLKREAECLGLTCFSTPFDDSSVDFLETLNVPAYKIASFELIDVGLLQKVARTRKPIILSTGMATFEEIGAAVQTLRKAGCEELALLKCTSSYPSRPEDMNLKTIPHMQQAFGVPVGLSDHTLGLPVPIAAVALGACIIEKHLTLRRADGGPDSAFSLEPDEFREMVEAVRVAEKSFGEVSYALTKAEQSSRVFRRSLFAVEDIQAGQQFTTDNVRSIRPSHGLHPGLLGRLLGRRATRTIKRGSPLNEGDVAWDKNDPRN
jgi:pseudaminic acid synthase